MSTDPLWETEVRVLTHNHIFRGEEEVLSMHALIHEIVTAGLKEGTLVDLTTMRMSTFHEGGMIGVRTTCRGTRRDA